MTDQAMGIDRFCRLIDAYGAEPERWPVVDRAAAIAFRAQSAEARAYRAPPWRSRTPRSRDH